VRQTTIEAPIKAMNETSMVLEELIREGARKMLKAALEAEIAEHLAKYQSHKDETGRQLVVRNGYQPEEQFLPVQDQFLSHVHASTTEYLPKQEKNDS